MQIVVITLFPELVEHVVSYAIPKRALESGQLELRTINPRDFALDRHRTVDDRPYGGGPGMVMMVQPLQDALAQARHVCPCAPVVCLTPQGIQYRQSVASEFAALQGLILIAGRYEGIDERFIEQEVDVELSVGDYVLSGGELAAMVVVDSVARLLPGVLGHPASALEDSFAADGLLDCPHYTRPEVLNGQQVPDVLLSGDHQRIRQWRRHKSLERTLQRRPDLLKQAKLDAQDQRHLSEFAAGKERCNPDGQ